MTTDCYHVLCISQKLQERALMFFPKGIIHFEEVDGLPFFELHILYSWNEPSSSSTICPININSVNIKQISKVLNFVKQRMKGGRKQ